MLKNLRFLLFILPAMVFAQVGIGITSPDASSILDVTSSTRGVLLPRMTTAQMNSIASPVKGLTIFNSETNSYYYNDGTIWVELAGAVKRDNYKLVKSVADLSDELAAGGGTQYLLNTNFLYEINGIIPINFPINLNGAYVEGVDSGSDILVNASGGSLFNGSGGGSIRNITISGGSNTVFNLTGGNLVVNNTIFSGASSLGTLTGLNLVFFNVSQYVNNTTGFTVSGIESFFMSNTFWTDTNQGTFMTLTGTFDNLQMANGRIVADAGEIGLNVSSNPTIVNSGLLSGLSFVGAGTLVNGYTAANTFPGYNFSIKWDVNCEGIPVETDGNASANFYSTSGLTTGFTQSISNGTAVEIQGNGAFAAQNLFRFTASGGDNRLTYTGRKGRNFQLTASLSVRVTGAADNFYAFLFAKNGTVITESNAVVYIDSNTQIQNVSLASVINLEANDYIEVFVRRLTGAGSDDLIVFSENVSIK
ncbi:hypothetical protein [Leeuwenhoekiella sp. MAR_2009_132]|uniref:hypothetical protein n=1 Tax=Leeuwenhoekiella sp. MAR_2009_132 TaxID=1392489 RepID=UPI00048E0C1A|nr:hypothetical protein [Leeuwenhoekiella sp. MAR_2009_132]